MSILSKASLVQIPSGYGEDKLYSEVPNTAAGDFTFTRSSTGTRVNSDGFIEEVPWNKSTYSEDFTNGNYVKNNCVVIADQADSPTGTTTADQIDFGSGSGFFYNALTAITQPSTYSIYVKYIDYQFIQIIGTGDVDHYANFDVQNGIVGNTGSQSTASIEDVGNGWYRCIINYNDGTFAGGARLYKTTSLTAGWASGGGVAGSFYFWGNQLVKGTSPKPYIKTTDRLDIPRLDYSGGASCPTLLLEPQRTNLIPYSQDFTSGWVGSVTPNSATSPDGTTNATLLADGSNIYYPFNSGTAALTLTLYAKSTDSELVLRMRTNTNVNCDVYFDLVNGVIISTTGNTWTNVVSSMEVLGDYYRCRLTATPPSGSFNNQVRIFALNGTSGCYIWGCQLEQGNYTTSYIPTNGTSVTRTLESGIITSATDLIGQTEGTLYSEFDLTEDNNFTFVEINLGNSTSNRILAYRNASYIQFIVQVGGTVEINNPTLVTFLDTNKIAITYQTDDFKIYLNGSLVKTYTSGNIPSGFDTIDLQDNNLNGRKQGIKSLAIFKEILTSTELETLTTI